MSEVVNDVYMILTNGFDPDVRVYKEAKYLVAKGFNVEILCWDRKCEYTEKTEEILDGIRIKRFHILSKPGTGMKQLGAYFKFIASVRNYLKNKKYSYLHCHDFDGILTGLVTKGYKKCKLIFDMHEIYKNYAYAKNKLFDIIFRYILNKSDYIIYVNDEQINNFEDKIKTKLLYLPNYPVKSLYNPINKTNNNNIRVNYIGAVRDVESLKTLAKVSNCEVGIYGIGTAYETLKNEFTDKSNVTFYGRFNGIKEAGEIYRNTDILYCVYNPEVENWRTAYPVKLYEAIVTETPIIVSDNTKVSKFVNDYYIGLSVKYGDVKKLEESIEYIKENYNAYKKSIRKISDNYNWEEIVKNIVGIYNQ